MDGLRMMKSSGSPKVYAKSVTVFVMNVIKECIAYSRERICSLLFPPRCPVCDEILSPEDEEKGIHIHCECKLFPVEGAVCMHCGRPLGQFIPNEERKLIKPVFESVYSREYCHECLRKDWCITQGKALYLYKGAIKTTMYRFKYSNKREYACFFAKRAAEKYGEWMKKAEMIIPVPMYKGKEKQRGYNQANILAEEISKLIDVPIDKKIVKRIKNTVPQKGLNDVERQNNLKKAFHIEKSIVKYNCVLIIDDIFTTGSTTEAVAKELKKRGVSHIYVFSICIGGDT